MNIVHICLSHGWGGLEMYPLRISPYLIKNNNHIAAIALKNSRLANAFKEKNIPVFEVLSRKQALLELPKIYRWLKEQQITIAHCHKSGDLLLARLLQLKLKNKIFFTEHMGGKSSKKDLLHRWIYAGVELVLSISNETRARNVQALPISADKIKRLWLGTELDNKNTGVNIQLRRELELPELALTIGIIGRIGYKKGQLDLLESFKLLADKHPNIHLLIVGGTNPKEGSDLNVVAELHQRIERYQLSDRVKLTGFRSDTAQILQLIDIVAIPSHNEAFGLTVIEAMAAKKAIVGADTGAIPEVLAECGLVAPPTNPQDFAAQLEILINDATLRSELGQKARERAEVEFSMERHLEQLLRYYRSE